MNNKCKLHKIWPRIYRSYLLFCLFVWRNKKNTSTLYHLTKTYARDLCSREGHWKPIIEIPAFNYIPTIAPKRHFSTFKTISTSIMSARKNYLHGFCFPLVRSGLHFASDGCMSDKFEQFLRSLLRYENGKIDLHRMSVSFVLVIRAFTNWIHLILVISLLLSILFLEALIHCFPTK